MSEPTEAQIKEFWEWCGWKQLEWAKKEWHYERTKKVMNWTHPLYEYGTLKFLPRIDLNNLFKYAVPKVHNRIFVFDYAEGFWGCQIKGCEGAVSEFDGYSKDPALALFWALWQVKESGK